MNEYKIQLESKEDLVFLKQEFDNFLNANVDSASTVSDNIKNQFIERVFAIVTENVQINGVDWSEAVSKNSAMEAVNNDLVTRLQDMQAETESLMRRVIQHRREAPIEAKRAFIAQNEELLNQLKQEQEQQVELSPEDLDLCNFDTSITPNFYSNKLSSGLANLSHLQKTIPGIVAKLERAQAVITEEGGKRADENSQLLHRHRRLSRQFDLASKIGGF